STAAQSSSPFEQPIRAGQSSSPFEQPSPARRRRSTLVPQASMSIALSASIPLREPPPPPPLVLPDTSPGDPGASALPAPIHHAKAGGRRPCSVRPLSVDAEDAALRAKLTRVVARACPSWAVAQQEDIVQAAMIRVIRARARREHGDVLPDSYLWKAAYS